MPGERERAVCNYDSAEPQHAFEGPVAMRLSCLSPDRQLLHVTQAGLRGALSHHSRFCVSGAARPFRPSNEPETR